MLDGLLMYEGVYQMEREKRINYALGLAADFEAKEPRVLEYVADGGRALHKKFAVQQVFCGPGVHSLAWPALRKGARVTQHGVEYIKQDHVLVLPGKLAAY